MIHRTTSLTKTKDYVLFVGFEDGTYKQFDLKPLIAATSAFKALKDIPGLYGQGRIDRGGYGIIWNAELDLSGEAIYEQGTEIDLNFVMTK